MSPKQAERAAKRAEERRRLLLRAALVLGVAALLLGGWVGVSRSQLFEIESVDVSGNSRLTADQIVERAALPDGVTLLRIDTDAVEEALKKDPWISDVSASRRIPSTLSIAVEERVPVAVVDTGVRFWLVDERGRVLSECSPGGAAELPVVRDVPDFAAEPGVVTDSKVLRNALAVLAGISDELLAVVRTVSAPSVDETALLTASSVEIMIGKAERLDEKSVLVADILRDKGEQVVFIDVRSVERPISRGLGQ